MPAPLTSCPACLGTARGARLHSVMVYGHGETRTVEVANCVMTLASLFPGCLRHGFKRGAVVPPDGGTALGDLSGAFDAASIEPPLVPSRASSVEPAMRFAAPDDVPAEAQDSAIAAEPTTADVPSGDGPPASMAERTERACLPLCLCHNNVYPYVALQQLDKLQSDRSFLVGVTNALFARRPELSDAVVDVTAGTVEVKNKRLSKVMSLTTEDLRFIDGVLAVAVEATESEQGSSSAEWAGTNWVGSSAWVRAQFFEYVLGLMATADKVRTRGRSRGSLGLGQPGCRRLLVPDGSPRLLGPAAHRLFHRCGRSLHRPTSTSCRTSTCIGSRSGAGHGVTPSGATR